MKTIIAIILILILNFLSLAATFAFDFDPFNSYQYNVTTGKNRPWFEWWYYKVVLPETGESFFFIYGVVNPWDINQVYKSSRSYVSFGDFSNQIQVEKKYSPSDFSADYNQTNIQIHDQHATDQYINGFLTDEAGEQYKWDIAFTKDWAYNATGWATGKNITNIEWYPAQAGAHCSGTIISKNKIHHFTNAPCYQDHNWGTKFPLWWTWIVSNNFTDHPETILAIGGGRPEYFGTKFPLEGASIGLHHNGIDYHFRPNDLDRIKTDVKFGQWKIKANNLNTKIEVDAFAPKEKFMDLQFMTPDGSMFHDYEALMGAVTVRLYKRELGGIWKLSETLYSKNAGIEFGSQKESTLDMLFSPQLSIK